MVDEIGSWAVEDSAFGAQPPVESMKNYRQDDRIAALQDRYSAYMIECLESSANNLNDDHDSFMIRELAYWRLPRNSKHRSRNVTGSKRG